ncbi:MAG: YaiI/YqxD family protein [Gammaproteobacteria bacterium]|nr:YaiI/YqxD family protein [Gammaproteobacteria bacterium]
MKIWVDADACPNVIKQIIFRAANRMKVHVLLISNHPISLPHSPYIKQIQVPAGFDKADDKIVLDSQPGDLIITGDIPLASLIVEKGGHVLNPRGEQYSPQNIKQRLAFRNQSEALRSSGIKTEGPAKITKREIALFGNALDKILTKLKLKP